VILYSKSEEELNKEALDLLQDNTDIEIKNNSPGSRAKALLKIINKILTTYYQALDFNVTMFFVSKATGLFLDEIGVLLNCSRDPGESDDNYRYRICNQVYVVEGANRTAVRLASLSVENVADVVLTPWVFGTGSFAVHVITNLLENLPDAIVKVQAKLDDVEGYGIKGKALAPKIVSVFTSIIITFFGSTQEELKQGLVADIRQGIVEHINQLQMGQEFILSDLIYIAKDIGKPYVQDVTLTKLEISKKPVLIANYKPYWDEKLYVDANNDIAVA
jgi:uncharacterized phage protein gp47/JayE